MNPIKWIACLICTLLCGAGANAQRTVEQRNIWNCHQSVGLGYFEYFQFCEDIGAKAVPVVPAAVSCQNSGGTWHIGGTGQKGLPMAEFKERFQLIYEAIRSKQSSVPLSIIMYSSYSPPTTETFICPGLLLQLILLLKVLHHRL